MPCTITVLDCFQTNSENTRRGGTTLQPHKNAARRGMHCSCTKKTTSKKRVSSLWHQRKNIISSVCLCRTERNQKIEMHNGRRRKRTKSTLLAAAGTRVENKRLCSLPRKKLLVFFVARQSSILARRAHCCGTPTCLSHHAATKSPKKIATRQRYCNRRTS